MAQEPETPIQTAEIADKATELHQTETTKTYLH